MDIYGGKVKLNAGSAGPTPQIDAPVNEHNITSADGLFQAFHSNKGINRAFDHNLACPIEQQGVILVSHSRLDNHTVLCNKLGVDEKDRHQMPDHLLMLQAFLKWGPDCVHQFRGDWSFVVWDTRSKTFYAAVDYISCYGLYYHHAPDQFTFSNSLKTMVSQLPGPIKPNLSYLLNRFLIHRPVNAVTSIEGVWFVPPGSYLTLKPGAEPSITRYWTPAHLTKYDVHNESEMIQEFQFLYEQAVERRILKGHNIASHLSGGLDSGSVSWLASKYLKAQGRPLHGYTGTEHFDTSATLKGRGNEDQYAKITAAATGHINQRSFSCPDASLLESIRDIVSNSFEVAHGVGNIFWIHAISAFARNEGIDTLLVGQVGNASVTWQGISGKRAFKLMLQDFKKDAELMFLKRKPLDEIDRFPGTFFNTEMKSWFKRD
jgi:asparagine synthase (glutamine-hydrolysing)